MAFKPSHAPRRPSLTSPMSWLTRTPSQASQATLYAAAAKPMRISEPTLEDAPPRVRELGTGALVVRTPDDALAGSGVRLMHGSDDADKASTCIMESEYEGEEEYEDDASLEQCEYETEQRHPATPPETPPRPPLPLSKSSPSLPLQHSSTPARPTRPPPPPPVASEPSVRSVRSVLKTPSPPISAMFPPVPPLPAHLHSSPAPPPFECILLSPVPAAPIDASKVIVTLETSTASHKTTLSTLTSRPSHLADYLKSLFRRNSDASSVYSRTSEYCDSPDTSFNSIFHHHLESSGLLPQSSTHMHIFLDRASASYEHILAFLRSPPSTIDYTTTLPHAVQLHTYSTGRIEALVALRDEARYLGLDDLHKLCVEELRTRQPRTHTRGADSMSSTGSIQSTHTMRDRDSGERTLVSSERDGHGRDSLGSGTSSAKSARSRSSDVASLAPLSSPSPSLQQKLADRGRKDAQGVFSLRSRGTANWL